MSLDKQWWDDGFPFSRQVYSLCREYFLSRSRRWGCRTCKEYVWKTWETLEWYSSRPIFSIVKNFKCSGFRLEWHRHILRPSQFRTDSSLMWQWVGQKLSWRRPVVWVGPLPSLEKCLGCSNFLGASSRKVGPGTFNQVRSGAYLLLAFHRARSCYLAPLP